MLDLNLAGCLVYPTTLPSRAVPSPPPCQPSKQPPRASAQTIVPMVSQRLQGHEIGIAIISILPQLRKRRNKKDAAMEEVGVVLTQFASSRAAMEEHKFFLPMMAHLVLNKLRPASDVQKALTELTEEDGQRIGMSLAVSLATNLMAEAGVDEWIVKFPALREFEDDQAWFRSSIVAVAKQLLKEATWGSKMRLFVGAGLSMIDLASDIAMVVTYLNEGLVGTARSLLVMISACLLLQLYLVYLQTSRGPRRVMIKEMLIVLSGTKPGVDAMRVASGAEPNEHNVFNPEVELTFMRMCELFCEAIPGCILQFTAAMRTLQGGKPVSNIAVGSIVISALTTGYTGTRPSLLSLPSSWAGLSSNLQDGSSMRRATISLTQQKRRAWSTSVDPSRPSTPWRFYAPG